MNNLAETFTHSSDDGTVNAPFFACGNFEGWGLDVAMTEKPPAEVAMNKLFVHLYLHFRPGYLDLEFEPKRHKLPTFYSDLRQTIRNYNALPIWEISEKDLADLQISLQGHPDDELQSLYLDTRAFNVVELFEEHTMPRPLTAVLSSKDTFMDGFTFTADQFTSNNNEYLTVLNLGQVIANNRPLICSTPFQSPSAAEFWIRPLINAQEVLNILIDSPVGKFTDLSPTYTPFLVAALAIDGSLLKYQKSTFIIGRSKILPDGIQPHKQAWNQILLIVKKMVGIIQTEVQRKSTEEF